MLGQFLESASQNRVTAFWTGRRWLLGCGPDVQKRRIVTLAGRRLKLAATALLSLMAFLIVLLEQVCAEISAEIAPHRVNVIGFVLRVVEFDQE